MNKSKSRLIISGLQITVESAKFMNKEHSFINNCTTAQRTNICFVVAVMFFKLASGNIKSAIKINSLLTFRRTRNKCLPDIRHTVARLFTKNFSIYRNLTPAKELQAFCRTTFFKTSFFRSTNSIVSRKEKLTNTVIAFLKRTNQILRSLLIKLVTNLNKNTYTISSFTAGIFTCTVFKFFNDTQGIINNFVRFRTVNIYYRTNTASIMFKCWFIQSFHLTFLIHEKKAADTITHQT